MIYEKKGNVIKLSEFIIALSLLAIAGFFIFKSGRENYEKTGSFIGEQWKGFSGK